MAGSSNCWISRTHAPATVDPFGCRTRRVARGANMAFMLRRAPPRAASKAPSVATRLPLTAPPHTTPVRPARQKASSAGSAAVSSATAMLCRHQSPASLRLEATHARARPPTRARPPCVERAHVASADLGCGRGRGTRRARRVGPARHPPGTHRSGALPFTDLRAATTSKCGGQLKAEQQNPQQCGGGSFTALGVVHINEFSGCSDIGPK